MIRFRRRSNSTLVASCSRAAVCLVVFAATMGMASPAPADVCIVRSGDATPFITAEAEIIRMLNAERRTFQRTLLDALERSFTEENDDDDAVDRAELIYVAIGSEVAVRLNEILPEQAILVYCLVTDPASIGLTSRKRTMGVSTTVAVEAQFSLIRDALPRARRIGMLFDSSSPRSRRHVDHARAALPDGWELAAIDVRRHDSLADAINALLSRRVDIVWTAADSAVYDAASIRSLLLASLRREVPVFGFSPAFVRAGALVGIGIDPATQGKQAAELLRVAMENRGIVDGRTPGTKFPDAQYQVAINLIVADRLSVTLPPSVIARAAVVFRSEE